MRLKTGIAIPVFVAGVSAALLQPLVTSAQEIDSATGLIVEDGWTLVQDNCTECHSSLLITQNSGNRAVWESRIRWMQDTQGLKTLESDVENQILDYLSTHYGQKQSGRRAPLAADLMPSNPYPVE